MPLSRGGLARDVIRAARQVARNAATLISGGRPLAASNGIENGDEASAEYESHYVEASNSPPTLSDISAVVLYDELRRKLRALSQVVGHLDSEGTTEFQDTLYDISVHLTPNQPIIDIVDLIASRATLSRPQSRESGWTSPPTPTTVLLCRKSSQTGLMTCTWSRQRANHPGLEARRPSGGPECFYYRHASGVEFGHPVSQCLVS